MSLHTYFVAFGLVQLLHSQEEIWTGFHKKWFVFTMPRWVFMAFEALLSATIIAYILYPHLSGAVAFSQWFIFAMLLNGMEHIVWAAVKKTYVPGLITAPLFLVLFIPYYANLVRA
jgi:hypothetical protein